jgi:hypothetical protein
LIDIVDRHRDLHDFGRGTALRAAPFPEWQDEGKPPPAERGADDCLEEHP